MLYSFQPVQSAGIRLPDEGKALSPGPWVLSGDELVASLFDGFVTSPGCFTIEPLRLAMWQKREAAVNAFEPVGSNSEVVAALKFNELNASGLNPAFVDSVKGVDFAADHCLEMLCRLRLMQ